MTNIPIPLPEELKEGDIVKLCIARVTERGVYLTRETPDDGRAGAGEIFMPRGEIRGLPMKGETVWAGIYLTGERLTATMKLDKIALRNSVPAVGLKVGDTISGLVYNLTDAGAFIRTPEGFLGHIPNLDLVQRPRIGQLVEGRVTYVRDDGRFNLSTRPVKEVARVTDAELILEYLRSHGGQMPFSDNSSPEAVSQTFGVSKKAFKRALGKLLKDGLIVQETGVTRLKGAD